MTEHPLPRSLTWAGECSSCVWLHHRGNDWWCNAFDRKTELTFLCPMYEQEPTTIKQMQPVFLDKFYTQKGANYMRFRGNLSDGWKLSLNPDNGKLKATWQATKRDGKQVTLPKLDPKEITEKTKQELAAICLSRYIAKRMAYPTLFRTK